MATEPLCWCDTYFHGERVFHGERCEEGAGQLPRPRRFGGPVDDHNLVTKVIALEGAAILAQDFADVAGRLGLREEKVAEAR